MISGVLVLDKPEGPTSHDVVGWVRRLLRIRQVGHTGTLDPMATGVLVLCAGRATRLARFLTASRKVYRARVRLGQETDTLDRTGAPCGPPRPVDVSPADVDRALAGLTGRRLQAPPSYSAKRVGGVRAHRLARAGAAPALEPVPVEIESFEDVRVEGPEVAFTVTCSAGTYVRSLAHELGEVLDCGGHLTALRRLRSGEFSLSEARTPERLQQLADRGALDEAVIPAHRLRLGLPAVVATEEGSSRISNGQALQAGQWSGEAPAASQMCRLLGPSGDLLAIVASEPAPDGARLRPRVVLARPAPRPPGSR